MKMLSVLGSQALRYGCSYFGLNNPTNKNGQIVFLFKNPDKMNKFCKFLEIKNYKFETSSKADFFNVYLLFDFPFTVVKKILFKSFRDFVKKANLSCHPGFPITNEIIIYPNYPIKIRPKYSGHVTPLDIELNNKADERMNRALAKNSIRWGKKIDHLIS